MIGSINNVLSWRWMFRILGIAGFVITPLAILVLYEPKSVHEKRISRISGKRTYSILVSPFVCVFACVCCVCSIVANFSK